MAWQLIRSVLAVEICTNSTAIVSLRGLPEDLTFEISDDDKIKNSWWKRQN
jgi:hypothetical protein